MGLFWIDLEWIRRRRLVCRWTRLLGLALTRCSAILRLVPERQPTARPSTANEELNRPTATKDRPTDRPPARTIQIDRLIVVSDSLFICNRYPTRPQLSICIYICIHLFLSLSFCLSACSYVRVSVSLAARMLVLRFVCLSVQLFVSLSVSDPLSPVCLSVRPSFCLFVSSHVHRPTCLSVRLPICMSVCLSIWRQRMRAARTVSAEPRQRIDRRTDECLCRQE